MKSCIQKAIHSEKKKMDVPTLSEEDLKKLPYWRQQKIRRAQEQRAKEQAFFDLQQSGRLAPPSAPSKHHNVTPFKYDAETANLPGAATATAAAIAAAVGKRRYTHDVDPLERESDNEDDQCPYLPAPNSPGADAKASGAGASDDEEDPLDAFMAGVEVQAKRDKELAEKRAVNPGPSTQGEASTQSGASKKGLGRVDIDEEDMQESYFRWMEEHKNDHVNQDDEEIEYDEDGNPLYSWKRVIDPLPAVDHDTIEYDSFNRDFYTEHDDIKQLNEWQVDDLRKKLGIRVGGVSPPKPVSSFAHFGFDEYIMAVVRKAEFSQPTPIQAQAIPCLLSGRDVVGIAKTGSGKTAAYLWPAIVHLADQRPLAQGEGPIVLVCVPTRELAIQVYNEARKVARCCGARVVCAYGGGSKWEQTKALQAGAEIVVATPGRLIDMVKIGATNLTRVTYLVFDEADRMFDLGFEPQVRSISTHIRPDRQCSLFSATFKKKVERLARDALFDPVRVVQGEVGEANEDITQIVHVLTDAEKKWTWISQNLVSFCTQGKVLIFVTKKADSEVVAEKLRKMDFKLNLLHGDMLQHDRNERLQAFRKDPDMKILVATDVAARGLDIPEIRTVINFDVARDADTHVHRVGRTGRAGQKGTAYTLVTQKDKEFAGHLVKSLESVNQPVIDELMKLAMQSDWFKKYKSRGWGKKSAVGPKIGGKGLGYKGDADGPSSRAVPFVPNTKIGTNPGFITDDHGDSGDTVGQAPTNRLSVLKSAFSASYKSKFQKSEATEWVGNSEVVEPEQQAQSRKRKSRWE